MAEEELLLDADEVSMALMPNAATGDSGDAPSTRRGQAPGKFG